MNWVGRLFSLNGRAPRRTYWLVTLPCVLVMLVGVGLTIEEGLSAWLMAIGGLITLAALAPVLTVSVRRLHDRNKAWWWMLIYWLIPTLFGQSIDSSAPLFPLPEAVNAGLMLLSTGISLWSFVDLGLLKGTPGPNRFGPDPFGRGVAEVFT